MFSSVPGMKSKQLDRKQHSIAWRLKLKDVTQDIEFACRVPVQGSAEARF